MCGLPSQDVLPSSWPLADVRLISQRVGSLSRIYLLNVRSIVNVNALEPILAFFLNLSCFRCTSSSIRGPLLFNIFMNSISELSLIIYADDILLYRPINSAIDAELLQKDVNLVLSWMKSNSLSPNFSKHNYFPSLDQERPPLSIFISMVSAFNCVNQWSILVLPSHPTCPGHIQHIALTCQKAKHLGPIPRSTTRFFVQLSCPNWNTAPRYLKHQEHAKVSNNSRMEVGLSLRVLKTELANAEQKLQKVCYNILSIIPATPHHSKILVILCTRTYM